MLMPIKRIIGYFLLACVGLAIWRASGEDAGNLINGIWDVIDRGATILSDIWASIQN